MTSQVPCLAYREESGQVISVYESLICNEFLEDFASPPVYPSIFPPNAATRARARIIIDRFDRKFIPNFYGILSKSVIFPAFLFSFVLCFLPSFSLLHSYQKRNRSSKARLRSCLLNQMLLKMLLSSRLWIFTTT